MVASCQSARSSLDALTFLKTNAAAPSTPARIRSFFKSSTPQPEPSAAKADHGKMRTETAKRTSAPWGFRGFDPRSEYDE